MGGWRSSETSKAFGDYAGHVAARISDRVRSIFTINEAGRFVNFGYGWGVDAPGLKLPDADVNQVRHHVALAHGLAVQAIRAHGRAGTRVGPAENIAACVPAFDTPENVRAAEMATRELNSGFLGVILEGKYTDGFLQFAGPDAPKFTDEELKIISSPNDFVGLNIYAPQFYIAASDKAPGWSVLPFPASFPHMNSEWLRVGPETIYWAPRLAAKGNEGSGTSRRSTSARTAPRRKTSSTPTARSTTSIASCTCAIISGNCSARRQRACRSAAISSGA